jgi:hypothetical protein
MEEITPLKSFNWFMCSQSNSRGMKNQGYEWHPAIFSAPSLELRKFC